MVKKLTIITIICITSFSFGAIATAKSNWMGDLKQNMISTMDKNISNNTNTLINGIQDKAQSVVSNELGKVVDYQSGRAKTEIDTYYDEKMKVIAASPEVKSAIKEVMSDTDTFIAREKQKIDAAVSSFLGN